MLCNKSCLVLCSPLPRSLVCRLLSPSLIVFFFLFFFSPPLSLSSPSRSPWCSLPHTLLTHFRSRPPWPASPFPSLSFPCVPSSSPVQTIIVFFPARVFFPHILIFFLSSWSSEKPYQRSDGSICMFDASYGSYLRACAVLSFSPDPKPWIAVPSTVTLSSLYEPLDARVGKFSFFNEPPSVWLPESYLNRRSFTP